MNETLSSRHVFIFLIIAFLLAVTVSAVALGGQWDLLATNTNTGTTSSPSGLEIITSNGRDELAMLRGCVTDEILKRNAGGVWACASDISTSATGAGVVALDLSDDGVNESSALAEIATVGDTNTIFTEPSADKLLITLSNDWPKADAADALAANPADCAASAFAIAIAANGNLTCAAVNFTDLAGTATDAQIPNTITIDLAATATALAANGANCSAGSYPLGVSASGAAEGCTVAFYQTVEDEGGALTQRTNINFTGAGVSCADTGGKTVCTISGGGGGSVATDVIWDAKGDLAVGTGADTAAKLTVGVTGSIVEADPSTATGLKWRNAPDQSGFRHKLANGAVHYPALDASTTSGTRAITANVLIAEPIYFAKAVAVDAIIFNVATAAAAGILARVGLYADNGSLYPGALLADYGTVLVDATGVKVVTGGPTTLPANTVIWVVIVSDGAPTLTLSSNASARYLGMGTVQVNRFNWGYEVAFAFAALPDPFTAAGALQNTVSPGNPPFMSVRLD